MTHAGGVYGSAISAVWETEPAQPAKKARKVRGTRGAKRSSMGTTVSIKNLRSADYALGTLFLQIIWRVM
ncbi:hypothetical protein GCM10009304_16500 [Pseudomonas matsuisoli]|uniref:Uncharacterized protein n=1 Tax=Pseudomonas matsuisoli TaxID=1515666 RepID=A0A917UWW5_9PSED|nr:hypothetical protein GCM10009304_16500 [Pseudomonas matsuisoli]